MRRSSHSTLRHHVASVRVLALLVFVGACAEEPSDTPASDADPPRDPRNDAAEPGDAGSNVREPRDAGSNVHELRDAGSNVLEPGDAGVRLGESAAKLAFESGSASGVYLGEGTLLTNWHVCHAGRPVKDRSVVYNAPAGDRPAYQEFAADAQAAEPDAGTGSSATRAAPFSLIADGFVTFPFSPKTPRSIDGDYGGRVLFAQEALDLCVVELMPKTTELPPEVEPLLIDTHEVTLGQQVIAAGYPLGASYAVVERCRVTAIPADVRDPDLVNPTDRIVRSFAIDCTTTQHGSSGSPVFDAKTGALLGLLWTGNCTKGIGRCEPPAYVSAASEWLKQGDRPPSQYSYLTDLLDRFESP